MTRLYLRNLILSTSAVLAAAAFCFPAVAQDHEHHMTPEVYKTLRDKIPLYQEYTDEQINESMERMGPNYDVYVSAADVRGEIGILGLGHGFKEPGDTQFKEAFIPISSSYPTAVGYGMAMMTSAPIQSAVDNLTAAGAKTIVVMPTSYTDFNNLARQWKYIFGMHDTSSYLDVPLVETEAKVIMAPAMSGSPVVADIMTDFAKDLSTDPANELVIVASHGPTDAKENEDELVLLEAHADIMRQNSDYSAIKVITLQDDAPSAVRAANIEKFRGWVESATAEGKRVIVVCNLLTTSSVHRKIKRDLEGLDYDFNTTGMMLHPDFQKLIQDTVAQSLEQS